MNTTNGKIAEQSRKKLTDALFSVMRQYSFKEITITQLTQEAGLSRKTFYRLFSSKEDILNAFFQGVFQDFSNEIEARQIHHYWDVVQLYFDFWEKKRELLALLKKSGLLYIPLELSYTSSLKVFQIVRSKETAEAFLPLLPYMLAYAVGGMHTMLVEWIEHDMDIPSALLIEKLKTGFQSPEI